MTSTNGQQLDLQCCRSQEAKPCVFLRAVKVNVSFISHVNLRVAQCIFISSFS